MGIVDRRLLLGLDHVMGGGEALITSGLETGRPRLGSKDL